MPEELEIDPNLPPSGEGNPEAPRGIERATADIDSILKLDEPEVKPELGADGKPKPAEPVKPAAPAKPASDPKPEGDPDDLEFEKVIKPNAKAWKEFEKVKKSWKAKESTLQGRIKELESKANPTAADGEKLKQLEAQLAERVSERESYEKRIAALDYRQTAEFREKFVSRYERTAKEAVEFVSKLKKLDELGDVIGDATEADFEAVRSARPQDRRAIAKKIFGDNAADVMDYVREMDKIRSDADAAVQNHSENHSKIIAEQKLKAAEGEKAFSGFRTEAQKLLETKYPDLFSPDHYKDKPDLQKRLIDGYAYVDQAIENGSKMSPDERAAVNSVVRSRAAAMPLLLAQKKMDAKRISELEAEITKLRGGDPGNLGGGGGGGGGGGEGEKKLSGIEAHAAEFDS